MVSWELRHQEEWSRVVYWLLFCLREKWRTFRPQTCLPESFTAQWGPAGLPVSCWGTTVLVTQTEEMMAKVVAGETIHADIGKERAIYLGKMTIESLDRRKLRKQTLMTTRGNHCDSLCSLVFSRAFSNISPLLSIYSCRWTIAGVVITLSPPFWMAFRPESLMFWRYPI